MASNGDDGTVPIAPIQVAQLLAQAQNPIATHPDEVSQPETIMHDITSPNPSPTSTDYEYMSDEEDYASDEPVPQGRMERIGEAIADCFPNTSTIEYEDDEARDIFDDGLESDEDSKCGSDISDNFEELDEPSVIVQVIRMPKSEGDTSSDESTESNDHDDAYESSEDEWAEEGEDEDTMAVGEDSHPAPNAHDHSPALPIRAAIPQSPEKPFDQLQSQRHVLFSSQDPDAFDYPEDSLKSQSLTEDADKIRWKLLELEEMKATIEREISTYESKLTVAETRIENAQDEFEASLDKAGISQELHNAYIAFCESLDPKFGQRGGFSITCNTDHKGSYTGYDPAFEIFKESVEMDYNACNFRCEASTAKARVRTDEYVVEFWPIKCQEPEEEGVKTWGEQYPELYGLASDAVRAGSSAAMSLLINLPDMNSSLTLGGWIFDYVTEPSLANHTILHKRWRFRSAYKIDHPCTVEEKRKRLQLALVPEEVR